MAIPGSDGASAQAGRPAKPFYLDELTRKHEAFSYDEEGSQLVALTHQGRSLQLLVPRYQAPTDIRVSALEGDFLFLLGEQVDEVEEDGRLIEGGDGVVIVARKLEGRVDTYWALVWHNLYPNTLDHLRMIEARDSRS